MKDNQVIHHGNDPWAQVKEVLSQRIDARDFSTWIEPMIPRGATNGETNELELAAPNKFVQDWFNEHYAHFVRDILFELTDREFRVKVALDPSGRKGQLDFALPGTATVEDSAADASKRQARSRSFVAEGQGLNPRYTFSRYVVGANNQFACAACLSVAKKPGKTFNPVFLYGDTGLGKTHLLHAIGHYMLSGGKPMNIASMTSERFTNELIHAIHHGQINAFRKKYRRIDALLIDDIQFLAGKERTQEEFFHTFNDLYEAGAQIVVTSDRAPKHLAQLEERLRTRFSWGLIADLQPAQLETRIAILRERAKESGVELPPDTAMFLAEHFQSNIRELEGAFVRVSAYSSLNGVPISVDMARRVLRNLIGDPDTPVTVEQIQKAVCDHYKIKLSDLLGPRKQRIFAMPRQIASYMAREMTDLSFPEIGQAFGGRDHTTIMHAHRKIGAGRRESPDLDATIGKLERKIRGV